MGSFVPFSALTLLVGQQEGHPAFQCQWDISLVKTGNYSQRRRTFRIPEACLLQANESKQ